MFEEFKDKVLFVTGAASGMGRAVAVRFGSLGCKVAVAARKPDRAAETVRMVQDAGYYTVARITAFNDYNFSKSFPEWSITDGSGQVKAYARGACRNAEVQMVEDVRIFDSNILLCLSRHHIHACNGSYRK